MRIQMGKTREELEGMTMRQLRVYAKEIGCCLGYDGPRKESTVGAIVAFQDHVASSMGLESMKRGIPDTVAEPVSMLVVNAIRMSISNDTGQTLDSSLLIECPFCGCLEPIIQTSSLDDFCHEARVVCPSCRISTSWERQSWKVVSIPVGEDVSRLLAIGRAIVRWNTRNSNI